MIRNTAYATSGLLIQGVLRFVHTTVVGNVMPTLLGVLSSVLALVTWATLFWPAPAGIAASRFLSDPDHNPRAVVGALSRSTLAFSALACAVVAIVTWAFGASLTWSLWAALLTVMYGAYLYGRGAMIGVHRVGAAAALDLAAGVVTIGLLAVVAMGGRWELALMPLALGYLAFLVPLLVIVRSTIGTRQAVLGQPVDAEDARSVLRFTRATLPWMVSVGGLFPAAMLSVQTLDAPRVDVFAACLALATPPNMLAHGLLQVLLPTFAAGGEEMRARALRLHLLTLAGFVIAFGSLGVLAGWLLELVYPGKFGDGVGILRVLLVGMAAHSASAVSTAWLVATGREGTQARMMTIASLVGIALMVICGLPWGVAGVLVGFTTAGVLAVALTTWQAFGRRQVA